MSRRVDHRREAEGFLDPANAPRGVDLVVPFLLRGLIHAVLSVEAAIRASAPARSTRSTKTKETPA